jgi:hypothetical protein
LGNYTPVGPFNQGSSPPINKTFLDGVENALVAGGMIYFLGSFFQLTTNPTVNSGVTSALTASGGATGVPSGAKGVLISGSITSATVGAYVTLAAHSAGMTGVPQIGTIQVTNQFVGFGNVMVPLASNQIDVKANGGNVILQSWYINGYIM